MKKLEFSDRLRAITKRYGWSQVELGSRTGFSQSFISALFSGTKQPSLDTLMTLCSALGVTPNDLLLEPAAESVQDEGSAVSADLSEAEGILIDKYRLLSRRDRLAVETLMDALLAPEKGLSSTSRNGNGGMGGSRFA